MTHVILIGLYSLSAVAEVSGIGYVLKAVSKLFGRRATGDDSIIVSDGMIVRDSHDGAIRFETIEGWQAARGPVLIIVGIVIGLAGNIASVYIH
jgi:hypothetical protein